MPYITTTQTPDIYTNINNSQNINYSQNSNEWRNRDSANYNRHNGNGWTAMHHANRWYPGWQAYNYRWHNNCWWVYMRQGHHYRTVHVAPNYNWHWHQNGYRW